MNANQTKTPLIDSSADPCIYCRGTRAQYIVSRTEFISRCLNPSCKQPYRVPVTFSVHKVLKTVEDCRNWLRDLP